MILFDAEPLTSEKVVTRKKDTIKCCAILAQTIS